MHGSLNRGEELTGLGVFRESGRFGRLFPELPRLTAFKPGAEALGKHGGPLDGGSEPQDNERITAGYTFLGQFIDHDITLDITSDLEKVADPDAIENFRTPALELDSVYGMGPEAQPYLYDQKNPFRFLVDDHDLPRNRQFRALIGDHRNDENLIISQLHWLFLNFHNKVFDDHVDSSLSGAERFKEAQRIVRWHYQWIVVNEFLPRLLGTDTTRDIFDEEPYDPQPRPFMPVEFSVAAYRFGHSQVRNGYRVNPDRGATLFPPKGGGSGQDLRGFRRVPEDMAVDWSFFFGSGSEVQPSNLIDTKLASALLFLPDGVVPPGTPEARRSLAVRNLERGLAFQLPSGQRVAMRLGLKPIEDAELWSGVKGGSGPAPLWYYILKEAEIGAEGHRLTGVGAELVGRVIHTLLASDSQSYLVQAPNWVPTLPGETPERFTMTDLVNLTLGTKLKGEALSALPGDG